MRRSTAIWAVLPLVLVLATACSAQEGSKAGGDAVPVTLRIGTDDQPGRPAAAQIQEFARQVQDLSQGRIIIEPVWQADGAGNRDWDQRVARMVVDGDLDLGLIPSRAWDTEGVTSLRALNAPFLVNNDQLLATVVSDDVATDMLAGLAKAGITGLVLLPESMRQMFSFGEPLLTPAQFQGATIRAPRSKTTYAFFEALGATVEDVQGDDFGKGVDSGAIAGAEASFVNAGSLPRPGVATGNLIPFPKVNSLVMNSDAFGALSEAQQGVIRQAADATRAWAIGAVVDSPAAAAQFCADGGTVVVAAAADVAAFEQATAPVYAQLESDAQTRTIIQRIRELKSTTPEPAATMACTPSANAAATPPSSTGGAPSEFPEGVYRTEMVPDQLVAAGIDSGAAGIHTLTFQDGQFTHEIKRDVPDRCHGTYTVESGRVVVRATDCGDVGKVRFSARWTFDGTTLTLDDLRSDTDSQAFAQALWGTRGWVKIG